MRSTATVSARPRYGPLDLIALLIRELGVMIVVFLVVFVYFGLPAITNARNALNKLTQVRAELLLVRRRGEDRNSL